MGADGNDTAQPVRIVCGVQQRDAGTIGMADHDMIGDPHRRQHKGQVSCGIFGKIGREGFAHVRAAIAPAVIGERTEPGLLHQYVQKIAPARTAAETVMEKHQHRSAGDGRGTPFGIKAGSVDFDGGADRAGRHGSPVSFKRYISTVLEQDLMRLNLALAVRLTATRSRHTFHSVSQSRRNRKIDP